LLSNLSAEHEPSTQTAAGDFLKAVITISANATAQDSNVIGPNELTRQLVSEECVSMLIKEMVRGGNPLTVGVGIVIEVIRKNNSDYDLENQIGPTPKSSDPIYLGTLLRQFAHHIPDFINLIQSKDTTRKELKVAFGQKIEPLGFDRFKTCELMAELLHCSNMILLNQPGAESEVKTRDAERTRLKVEGKLTAFNEESSTHEFGTSVDSSGFHHARAPSFGNSSPEESKRLGVSNSTDEDFEDIPEPTDLVEAKDDFEKEPDEEIKPPKPAPLSISKTSQDAEAELASALDSMTVSEKPESADAPVKSEKTEEKAETSTITQSADTKMSPHPDDKPAPLFFGKPRAPDTANEGSESESAKINETHFEEDSETESTPFQADITGNPVVGDLLKMKFVEHKVVPTVIVSTLFP
jgi:SIT4-associating protein SAP185/190